VNELQAAIYQYLTTAPVSLSAVYDQPPQDVAGVYTLIGDETAVDWDTDDANGYECTVTLYSYHTNTGQSETVTGYRDLKIRMEAIYNALHHQALSVTGYSALQCVQEFREVRRSADGLSRQGIQRFRVIIHK
jgi:hypothetical protein